MVTRPDPMTEEEREALHQVVPVDLVSLEVIEVAAQPGVFAAVACPDCRQYVNATLGGGARLAVRTWIHGSHRHR